MIWESRLAVVLSMVFFSAPVIADLQSETSLQLRQSAIAFEHGRDGFKQDFQNAYRLYCEAALKGDSESAYNLGFMYFNGRGVSRDLALAVRWFQQAAEGGDSDARQMLLRFKNINPVEDQACKPADPEFKPLLEVSSNPNRQKVAGWVNVIAPHYGIDPMLVMAVIQAESAFNSSATSPKNAQGLMQLIPETAERFGVKDTWNPIQNIKGGTAYLHWLLRRFDGKLDWVLAAYNAGEGAVERYKGIPPYSETQNYVKQILAHYPKTQHPVPPETSDKSLLLSELKI